MLELLIPQIVAKIAGVGAEKAIDWTAKQIELMSKEQVRWTGLSRQGNGLD